jgi:hypothetical protein
VAVLRAVTTLGRAAALLLGTAAAGSGVWLLSRTPLEVLARDLLGPSAAAPTFDQVLSGACAAVLVLCGLWLGSATLLTVVALLARGYGETSPVLTRALHRVLDHALDRLCPALLRAVVTTALGMTVATTGAAPAPADDQGPARAPSGLDGLALPDRTVGAVPGRRPTVVVQPGDSLWGIAASLAPRAASDATVTRAWHRLYRVNATRIGPDPDLILPGTRLRVPTPAAPRRRDHP